MILPKNNISIMDVRNALGYPSMDLGTLCTCNNVNMWAKYKPVRYNFTTSRPSNWWKGQNGDCGMTINYYSVANSTNIQTLINKIKANESCFTYNKPRGGVTEPYRLGDFAGYNSNATHNVAQISVPDSISKDSQTGSANCSVAVQWIHDESMLSLTDMATNDNVYKLADWYLGALVVMPRDSTLRVVSNTTKLADMNNVDVLKFQVGGLGTMKLYPVICSVSTDSKLNTGAGGYAIPLPLAKEIEVQCVDKHKSELAFDNSSSVRLLNGSYIINFNIKYTEVQHIPDSINGYVYVCTVTQNNQPIGAWYRVEGTYTISLTAASGVAKLPVFSISDFNLEGINDPNCKGLMVRFKPYYSSDSSSVYGTLKF